MSVWAEAPAAFDAAAFQSLTGVSRETLERFEVWRRRLEEASAHTNLVSRKTLPDFWWRHAYDSWQLVEIVEAELGRVPPRWLDLGAGAGFPGLAVAFALMERGAPEAQVTLVDSVAKKMRFVEAVIAETGAPARALAVRAEALDPAIRYDVVSARALTALTRLLAYVQPFVDNGAIGVFPKGARHSDELTEARKDWTLNARAVASRTAPDAAVLIVERIARVR